MAREVAIGGSFSPAKVRNPWGVLGLSLVTLGIYTIFWWYYINREMADLGRTEGHNLGTSPGTSTAAWIFSGFTLGISYVWTVVTTTQRIQASQRVVGVTDITSGWLAAAVWILTLGIGGPVFTQYAINKVWEGRPDYSYQAAGTSQVTAAADPDLERVEKLAALKESGAISEDEYLAEKSKVLPVDDDPESTS